MYITFKQILIEALYGCISSIEIKFHSQLSHSPNQDNIHLRNLFVLESYLLRTDKIDNKTFGALVSNFPELIDHVKKEIRDEYL